MSFSHAHRFGNAYIYIFVVEIVTSREYSCKPILFDKLHICGTQKIKSWELQLELCKMIYIQCLNNPFKITRKMNMNFTIFCERNHSKCCANINQVQLRTFHRISSLMQSRAEFKSPAWQFKLQFDTRWKLISIRNAKFSEIQLHTNTKNQQRKRKRMKTASKQQKKQQNLFFWQAFQWKCIRWIRVK